MRRNKIGALQSILDARDQRALLKKQFTGKGYAFVSLSLNVPGFPKSNATVKEFFGYSLVDLRIHLKSFLVELPATGSLEICDAAGDLFTGYCSKGSLSLRGLKQLCEDFEENHPLGRFIDVDVYDEQGDTISSGKIKSCFLCREKPAIECRRQQSHDQEELRRFMFSEMSQYCRRRKETDLARQLSSLALKALLYEISLTPKPGLVDKFSNGSHADMNFRTFIDSSAAISGWFEELARAGITFRDDDFTKALPLIRNSGLRMEAAMYEATGNINTQKGIIFLMGLALFATGKLYSQGGPFNQEGFRKIVRDICKDIVRKELEVNLLSPGSHGEAMFRKYGYSGARGEAESGFRSVFEFGLLQLNGHTELSDQAMTRCFLAIAAQNNDTNILFRRGQEVLLGFQDLCRNALENLTGGTFAAVAAYCRNENISPGGSADLLAVSIFVWLVMDAEKRKMIPSLSVNNDF